MLEKIANRFQGIVLGALVLLISAVFILQFGGPQAEGCSFDQSPYVAQVFSTTVSEGDLRAALVINGVRDLSGPQLDQARRDALDGLVERSLLARQAKKLGFSFSEDEAMSKVTDDCILYLSTSTTSFYGSGQRKVQFPCKNKDDQFDSEVVSRFIQYQLRRSIQEFAEWQIDELLAQQMRQLVTSSVTISPDEVWDAYVRNTDRVTLKYVRYSPVFYKNQLDPNEATLSQWQSAHQKEVDAEYEKQKARFTNLEKQVRARHILIKVDPNAEQAAREQAFAKAETVLAKLKAGSDFEKLAKEYSEDQSNASKGGDLGFNPKGRMVEAFDQAQFSMKPGDISDIVETQFGYHIIKVEETRQGDVSIEDAKRELAVELYKKQMSEVQAQEQAQALFDKIKAGTPMEQIEKELGSAEEEDKDPLAPSLRTTREFGKTDNPIPGPFDSSPLIKEAFTLSAETPLPKGPIKLGDEWVVFRLEDRQVASKEGFTDEEKQRYRDQLLGDKKKQFLTSYIEGLQKDARKSNAIRINQKVLNPPAQGDDAQGEG